MRPTLLLAHGFPQDATLWAGTTAALGGAARVLAPDLRGFGADTRPVPAVLGMEQLAEDLAELLDAEGVHRAVVGGLSMGGYVALAFAERWPERVQALVLCNTRSTADTAEGRAGRLAAAEEVLARGTGVLARAMLPKLLAPATRSERPQVAAAVEAMMARQRPATVAAAALGMAARPDRTGVLQRLHAPVLVITGDADALMPLPTSEALCAAAPDARLVVIPGAGHLPNLEQPEAFHAALGGFLDALPR